MSDSERDRIAQEWAEDHSNNNHCPTFIADLKRAYLAGWSRGLPEELKPGTPEAVLRHVGIFKGDGDLDEQLAKLREQRTKGG